MEDTQYPEILVKNGIEYVTVTKLRNIVFEKSGQQPTISLVHHLARTGAIEKLFHWNFVYLRLKGEKSVMSHFQLSEEEKE